MAGREADHLSKDLLKLISEYQLHVPIGRRGRPQAGPFNATALRRGQIAADQPTS